MITTFIAVAAVMFGDFLFAPAPPDLVPRNEIERMVLNRSESGSREIERWLVQNQDGENRNRALTAAGFNQVRSEDTCVNYAYSRRLTDSVERVASISLCDGKPPFVLRSDFAPGPYIAPAPGQSPVTAPKPQ